MCGKPRKLTQLAKRSRQVAKRLSQPAVTRERVADGEVLRHRLPKIERDRRAVVAMPLHLDRQPGIGAAQSMCSLPAVNQPSAKSSRPDAVNDDVAVSAAIVPAAAIGRVVEIDAAARIAEIGRAGRGVKAARLLGQAMRKPAQFGGEAAALAPHFAEHGFCQQHAQARLAPVDKIHLDIGRVIVPGGQDRPR